jgi:hypothetical protein
VVICSKREREFTLFNLGKALGGEFVVVVPVHVYDWDAEVYDQFDSIRADPMNKIDREIENRIYYP